MAFGEWRSFQRARIQAQDYAKDRKRVRQLIEEVIARAYTHKGQLHKIWDDLMSATRMIKAWARGDYKSLSQKTVLIAIAAAIYFLNPFDLAPDFIPGVGYLDDATVIAFVLNSIRSDLGKFLEWENRTAV
jgi:uncharacterized membrane protein YkvA (DUF1232 family)